MISEYDDSFQARIPLIEIEDTRSQSAIVCWTSLTNEDFPMRRKSECQSYHAAQRIGGQTAEGEYLHQRKQRRHRRSFPHMDISIIMEHETICCTSHSTACAAHNWCSESFRWCNFYRLDSFLVHVEPEGHDAHNLHTWNEQAR